MAKKQKSRGLLRTLITWPWRKLPWWGKLIMLPALAAILTSVVFGLAEVLFGV